MGIHVGLTMPFNLNTLPDHLKELNADLFDTEDQRPLPPTTSTKQEDEEQIKARKWLRGKQAQAAGVRGEERATELLERLGIRMVAPIATPFVIIRRHPVNKEFVQIRYKEKVAGDKNCIMGDGSGRRVLVEIKNYNTDKLSLTKLTEGQRARLQENHELNGISLVVWIAPHGEYVLRWPVEGWMKGRPLDMGTAVLYNLRPRCFAVG